MFKAFKRFLKRAAIAAIVLVFIGGTIYMFYYAATAKPQTYTAVAGSPDATSSLEALINQETEAQMQNPHFIAQMKAQAREDVIMAIYNKTQMELVDEGIAK